MQARAKRERDSAKPLGVSRSHQEMTAHDPDFELTFDDGYRAVIDRAYSYLDTLCVTSFTARTTRNP